MASMKQHDVRTSRPTPKLEKAPVSSHGLPKCDFWEDVWIIVSIKPLILLVQLGGLEPPTS
jgi:hypothetical protein